MESGAATGAAEAEATTPAEALGRYAAEVSARKRGAEQERKRITRLLPLPLVTRSLASIRGKDIADYIHDVKPPAWALTRSASNSRCSRISTPLPGRCGAWSRWRTR